MLPVTPKPPLKLAAAWLPPGGGETEILIPSKPSPALVVPGIDIAYQWSQEAQSGPESDLFVVARDSVVPTLVEPCSRSTLMTALYLASKTNVALVIVAPA